MNDSKKTGNDSKNMDNDLRRGAKEPGREPAPEAAPAPAEAPGEQLGVQEALDALRAESTELKDRLLRTLAEMENLRRRTEREVAEVKTYAVTSFAREMLTFADNLRRALEHVPKEAREAAGEPWKGLAEGIEVTERDFLSRLGRFGVRKLEPLGARFDPHFHEALFELPDEQAPAGTVVQVIEDGYAIGERVLRPAKVGISRGGPPAANENAPR